MSKFAADEELLRLKSVYGLTDSDTLAEKEWDDLTRIAARICNAPTAFVSGAGETGRAFDFCAHAVSEAEVFIVQDASKDERFKDNPLIAGEPRIRFFAGAPLVNEDGDALGTLCVIDRRARTLSAEQTDSLLALARQTVALVSMRRRIASLERSTELLKQSEESYRIVARSASDVIMTIDARSKILFVNPSAEKVLGYQPEELIGRDLSIIIPERFRAAHTAGMRRYMESGTRRISWSGVELPAVRKDGAEIQIEISFGESNESGRHVFTAVIRDITERKQAERKLRASKERYRFLAEAVPHQIWTATPDGQLDYGNERTIEYFGKTAGEELLGSDWLKILHPEDVERTIECWTRAVTTGERYEIEFRLRRAADGEYRWHLAQAVPMRDEAGAIIKWFGANTDVHERKLADENARKSEEYRNLFRHASDAILIFDPADETVLDANERACEIYGVRREEFLGKSLRDISQEITRSEKPLRELQSKGFYEEFETVQMRADGTPIHFLINSSLIEYAGQSAVLSINRDVTARKEMETALREREERFRSIVETTNEWIWQEDTAGILTYNNPAVEKILGYAPEELHGKNFLSLIHRDDRERVGAMFRQSVAARRGWTNSVSRWIRRNGGVRFLESSATPLLDETGEIVGFRGTDRDITERRYAEQKMRESEANLAAAQRITRLGSWEIELIDLRRINNNPVHWSDEVYRIFGYAPGEVNVSINHYFALIHADDRKNVRRAFAEAVSERKNLDVEYRVVLPDGERVQHGQGEVIFDGRDGQPPKFIGTVQDITERKQVEEKIQESELRYRRLFESNPTPIWIYDVETLEFLDVNEEAVRHYGYTREEFMRAKLADFHPLEDAPLFKKLVAEADAGVEKFQSVRHRKKNGAIIETDVSVQSINFAGRRARFALITDITDRKRAEKQLLHDAFHDGLTGLANRALFMNHLRMAIERGKSRHSNSYAVLFLDFDRFKIINDSLGHQEGDKLLTQIARRLESSTRTGDLVARLGGDEFVVLLSELADSDEALLVAERIQNDLKSSFSLAAREIVISASIGVALSSAGHKRAEDMVRDADIAMYRAKAMGKAQYQVFDRQMHEHASYRLQLETEMRQALERSEFAVHYQPIMDLQTDSLMGFEALVRWNHPTRGLISPFEFVPAAEENGFILPLGAWVLEESCRQLRQWQNENPAASDLTVSVNLSCKQFLQFDLAEQIARTLGETGLDPRCLKLEITESHIMDNSETAITIMNRLRALGVELSLDDFGTGYSSLSYLHRLPVGFLKIDRSFVTRMTESDENGEIVSTIIKLAQNLKMRVVAEGIETDRQLAQLKALNCDYGQGYLFAKPLDARAARAFADKRENYFSPAAEDSPVKFGLVG